MSQKYIVFFCNKCELYHSPDTMQDFPCLCCKEYKCKIYHGCNDDMYTCDKCKMYPLCVLCYTRHRLYAEKCFDPQVPEHIPESFRSKKTLQ